jgi:flavin-dependent dehydrogenase
MASNMAGALPKGWGAASQKLVRSNILPPTAGPYSRSLLTRGLDKAKVMGQITDYIPEGDLYDMKRYKVTIIGGGPAGAMTALSLTHLRPELAGDILLLEAKSFPREKICGGAVCGRAVDFLDELGVSLQGIPRVPVKGMDLRFEDERYFAPFGHDNNYVVRRSVFDRLLLDQVRERNVKVKTATRAIGAYRDKGCMAVIDRTHTVYHTDCIVAADGVNGRSRTWFGVPHRGRKTILLQADIPRNPDSELLQDSLMMDFSPTRLNHSGYVWFFPSVGEEGEPVVNVGISGGEDGRNNISKLKEMFCSVMDRYPEIRSMAPENIKFKLYPERDFPLFQSRCQERVLFVGEQLGIDSFAGEGLSICAESAMAAAREIVQALDCGDFSFKGYAGRLRDSDFFPLLLPGKLFWRSRFGNRPPLALSIAVWKPSEEKDSLMELYTRLFSGDLPGDFVYSYYNLKTDVVRTLGYIWRSLSGRSPTA